MARLSIFFGLLFILFQLAKADPARTENFVGKKIEESDNFVDDDNNADDAQATTEGPGKWKKLFDKISQKVDNVLSDQVMNSAQSALENVVDNNFGNSTEIKAKCAESTLFLTSQICPDDPTKCCSALTVFCYLAIALFCILLVAMPFVSPDVRKWFMERLHNIFTS